MKIYDYDNKATEIFVSEYNIKKIYVKILSGDETGYIILKDGTKIDFDASNCRRFGFYDGEYILRNDDIKKWIEFDIDENRTISYQRYKVFSH